MSADQLNQPRANPSSAPSFTSFLNYGRAALPAAGSVSRSVMLRLVNGWRCSGRVTGRLLRRRMVGGGVGPVFRSGW